MDENGNAPQADREGTEVRHGLIGMVRAGDARVQQSASWLTTAKGGADVNQSASVALISGGDTSMKMSAAVAVPTLGDLHMEKSGAQWAIAAGDMSFEKGGCAVAVAPTVSVNNGGVGMALGWHVDVGENSRVLFGPLAAVALGLAFGAGAGLVMAASAAYAANKALKSIPRLPLAVMIVVRHSVIVDEPVRRAGFLWADFVAHRISDRDFTPDEWIQVNDALGVMGAGDVTFEAVSTARTKVTLSVKLDLQPSDPETGHEVEALYHKAVAHLDHFHDFSNARVG